MTYDELDSLVAEDLRHAILTHNSSSPQMAALRRRVELLERGEALVAEPDSV